MKKILKWTGIILGLLIVVAVIVVCTLNLMAKNRLYKTYDIQPETLVIPSDSASIAAGKKWGNFLCTNCHGKDLSGTAFFVDPSLGAINAPNITPGEGGIGKAYTDADWIRAIRHGVAKDKRPLLIMPSKDFQHFSEEHLGQIIAYVKTLPPVNKSWDLPKTTLMCNILFQLGAFGDALQVESIDHKAGFKPAPPYAETPEYGGYLVDVIGCRTCHGPKLNGGVDPNPQAPYAPNLTPGGKLSKWGPDAFIHAFRTGERPNDKKLSEFMPYQELGNMDDLQLRSIYNYLMTQPVLAEGPRK